MPSPRCVAFANNDYVHVAWDFGPAPLSDCGGFALYRIAPSGASHAVSTFGRDAAGAPTRPSSADDPIRKYSWRDVLAPRGETFKYRVVPMESPGKPLAGILAPESDFVTLTPLNGNAQVFFNRGILATQSTADALWNSKKLGPDLAKLTTEISDPNSKLREHLMGQHFAALTQLLDRAARDGGSCWASLYELTDRPLIDKLAACKDLHLILSNNDGEGKGPGQYDAKNKSGADTLEKTATELLRRYMPSGRIGHNKFVVYKDEHGEPKAVLTGSTNWTATGLCTQSNNAILIEDAALAGLYLEYWDDLKADALAAGIPDDPAPMKAIQGANLRAQCAAKRKALAFDDHSTFQAWFSPNTAKPLGKGLTKDVPVDLADVFDAIGAAKQSVLFLAFMPGKAGSELSMHFLKKLAETSVAKPALFIRGAVSDPDLTKEFDRTILASKANEDAMIASPQGIFKDFKKFRKEIYKYGHAIIHDKVIVIDPLSARDCVVVTGSHNLGFRASSNNDENLLVIRGNQPIALAYAMHVMDVFEHYRSRWISANNHQDAYDPDADPHWQDRYFKDDRPAYAERMFWLSEGKPLPPLKVNPKQARALAAALAELKRKAAKAGKAPAATRAAANGGAAKRKAGTRRKPATRVVAKKKSPAKRRPA